MLEATISGSLAHSIGWALVHFVWQGALAGAATALILAALRRAGANLRYIVACLGLFVMFVLPVATAIDGARGIARQHTSAESSDVNAVEAAPATVLSSNSSAAEQRLDREAWLSREDLEAWLPTAVLLWFAGVTVLSLRILSGWWIVRRMRSEGFAPAEEICASVRNLASRLRLTRPVRIMESALVTVPTVIGSFRPVLLWPAAALTGLSSEQIEAVIAHELAHIRRFDYFVNIMQTAVETLLFYHPAVWMISNRIRTERENCCDDLAVALCGDRVVYASALAGMEELRSAGAALALRATGGPLVERIRRLLDAPDRRDRRDPAWIALALIALVTALAITGADLSSANQRIPARPAPPKPSAAPSELSAAPPAPPASQAVYRKGEGRASWSTLGRQFELRYRGAITISDDDRDITQVAPDGYLIISEKRLFNTSRMLELRRRADGSIERRYAVDGGERPYEPEGRAWLADVLPLLLRRAAFAAEARVERILRQAGPSGVLSEISRLESDHARRVYFTEFLEQARPDGPALVQALDQAGREIGSDYELAELLITAATSRTLAGPESDAYFRALDSLGSDYEHRRVLSAAAKHISDPSIVAAMFDSASRIRSDYELAEFLISFAGPQLNDAVRAPFFRTLGSVQSDYEHRRVLTEVAAGSLSPETLIMLLRSTGSIGSSYERASLLVQIAGRHKLEGALLDAYIAATDGISSEQEKNRVLASLSRAGRRE